MADFKSWKMNEDRFVGVLGKLIGAWAAAGWPDAMRPRWRGAPTADRARTAH
jgi:hypothetical protein